MKDYVRTVGDVNGDGNADLVGFGLDGVYVALSNGIGFDAGRSLAPDSLHVGLRILRERAEGISARVEVQSAPGAGTTVCIELPHNASATSGTAQPAELPAPHR